MARKWVPELAAVTAILGAFGGGKTEIAINCAVGAAKRGMPVTLIDLDTVTPAFRSRQAAEALREAGALLVAPQGDLSAADLPAVPRGVRAALADPSQVVIVDAGGSPAGARVVSSLHDLAGARGAEVWVVVNPWRRETSTPREVADLVASLGCHARIPATGVVAGLRLPGDLRPEDIRRGLQTVKEGARLAGVKLLFCAVNADLAETVGPALPPEERILWLKLYMRAPWDTDGPPGVSPRAVTANWTARERRNTGG